VKYKAAPIRGFKAIDDGKGEFEAIVSAFGNVDLAGDRVVKGAFADSLKAWEAKGRPIPVVFSHMWQDIDAHIGEVTDAKETDEGLWVKAQLDMEDPAAAKVFRLLKRGTLAEFSFAYDIVEEKLQNGANELLKLDVIEVGPTLKGMNPATQLLTVKSVEGHETAARSGGVRAKQAVTGSFEERRELVSAAIRGKYGENDRYWVWVVATFDESAVVAIHSEDGASYREIEYTLKDGAVELGDERDVILQTTIVPKGRQSPPGAKSEEPGTAKSEDRASGKGKEPGTAKGEEPRASAFAARTAFELLEMGFR
jgi:HK97 family phage prohead protease